MTVTDVHKDLDALTLTVTAQFDVPIDRVWQLWDNPRQLERWWGPPTYPATVVDHDLTPGGRVSYFMTGPQGEQIHGWWHVLTVDAPSRLEFDDGFADKAGDPDPNMPIMRFRVALSELASGGTRMTVETTFSSHEDMDQIMSMGMEEGMRAAMSQIDAIL